MDTTDSPVNSILMKDDRYHLLRSYMKEAKTKSKAYSYSENHWRQRHKLLTYPVIAISAIASVLSGLDQVPKTNYIVMGLSLMTLIFTGFNSAVNPKDKEAKANQIKIEFGEIARNIKKFIYVNNKTPDDIKSYSVVIHEQMNIWNSLSPPISNRFVERAKKEQVARMRSITH